VTFGPALYSPILFNTLLPASIPASKHLTAVSFKDFYI